MLRRWWSKKYGLPRNHPLLEKQTISELLTEWYEDLWVEKREVEELLKNPPRGVRITDLQERLGELTGILEGREASGTGDPLIDFWEAKLARGEELTDEDLAMTMDDLEAALRG